MPSGESVPTAIFDRFCQWRERRGLRVLTDPNPDDVYLAYQAGWFDRGKYDEAKAQEQRHTRDWLLKMSG